MRGVAGRLPPRRVWPLTLAALLVALGACSPASSGGRSTSTERPSGTTASSPSPPPFVSQGPGESPESVRIRAPGGGSLLVRGRYPSTPSRCVRSERPSLLARYPGTLSVKRSGDGTLSLMVTLPFERYLEGIAEVPPSWPMAALEAQAIAARSYALATTGWSGSQGPDPCDADLRDQLVPGLWRHPGSARSRHPTLVPRRSSHVGRGPPVPGQTRRDRVLLHLQRAHLRERPGLRQ